MKRLLYFIMALLGFSVSCNGVEDSLLNPDNGAEVPMYGALFIEFHLSARVVDSEGEPIKGIKVYSYGEPLEYYANGSDAEGNIYIKTPWRWYDMPCVVEFVDTDGEANGGDFSSLELDITDKVTNSEGCDNEWCMGGYDAELGEVTMTKSEDNE